MKAIRTIDQAIVYESSKNVNRSSRSTRLVNKKSTRILKCHKKSEFLYNYSKVIGMEAITTIDQSIVYESSKNMNRSSRNTRIINKKSARILKCHEKNEFLKEI